MARTIAQLKAAITTANDLQALREAASELAEAVENLSIQFSQLYTKFNSHTHHFAVTDTNNQQKELAAGEALGLNNPSYSTALVFHKNVQPGTPIGLTRAR